MREKIKEVDASGFMTKQPSRQQTQYGPDDLVPNRESEAYKFIKHVEATGRAVRATPENLAKILATCAS